MPNHPQMSLFTSASVGLSFYKNRYRPNRPEKNMYTGTSVFLPHLSQRDINTARALYNTYNKKPDEESVKKAKVDELKDIGKRISHDPSSYIDLGDEYMSSNEYEKALEQYKKAELLAPGKDIYYRIVKAYRSLEDTDNEMVYLKKILQVDKSNKSAFDNIIYYYAKQRRYKDAKNLLDTFISDNPGMAKNSDIFMFTRSMTEK